MLKYPVLITSETQVKVNIWPKGSHSAHPLTTIHHFEAEPVHEA